MILPASRPAFQGGGGEPSELTPGASLQDYLAYAALNNPGLEAAFERWKAALERIPQVTSLPDPRFTYRLYVEEVETRVGPQEQSLGISQMFPWFGKLKLRGSVAAEAANAAGQRYEARKLALFYEVKASYYEYYFLARAIEVVRSNRDLLEYLEGVVRTRYKVGGAQYSDLIRAQVELGKLEDRLSEIEALREPVVARLNAALNRPIRSHLPAPAELDEVALDADADAILEWLRQVNPELKALAHEVSKEERAIELARKDFFPDLVFGVTYIATGRPLMSGTPDSGKDPVIAMVSMNIPIWLRKYRAGVREAQARRRAAALVIADRENALASRITMALFKFNDATRKIDLYRDGLVPKAEQSIAATEEAFRAGKASFLDVVDAQRVLLDFQLSYERALADQAQRLAELDMLAGREVPFRKIGIGHGENLEGDRL